MEMGVELAKKVNMFSEDFVYDSKNTVLTIPTLDSWESIQVHYVLHNLNINETRLNDLNIDGWH